MPRAARTRFVRRKRQPVAAAVPIQYCVVCYCAFHEYPIAPSRWASSMTKVFYKALNIPPFQTGGDEEGDEDDVLLSLPYCPECHSKISLMFNLYSQLEIIQNQYACIRNEIAFIVVETIDRNCRNGPMDFIRQQIYEKWQEYHAEESSKENYRDAIGLDAILALNYFSMKDITNNFGTDDDENVKSETEDEADSTGLEKQVPAEDLESPANIMEVEYDENTGFDQNVRNSVTLAPNAVHVVPKRQSKRTSTVVSTASSQANDDQHHTMYQNENSDYQDVLPDHGTVNFQNNALGQRKRRSVRGKHNMPRLLPMNSNVGRKFAQASLAANFASNTSAQNAGSRNFRGARGRGRGRGFRSSRFVTKPVSYNNLREDNAGEHHDVYDFNLNGDPKPFSRPNNSGPPMIMVKAKRGRPRGKASTFSNLKPMLRYPKRTSARPQRIKSDFLQQTGEMTGEQMGPNETSAVGTEGVYSCVLCPKFYTNPGRLLRHESLCHPSLKSIHCDVCGKGFSSTLTLRRHVNNQHPHVDHGTKKCTVCGKSFLKQYSLNLHMRSHKGVENVENKGKRISSRKLSTPIPQNPPPLSPAVGTRSPRKAREASVSMSNGEYFEYDKIKNPDLEANDYDPNGIACAASENDNNGLTCRICQKSFPYRTLLNMHFITHAARKSYKCESCNITFASVAEIKNHNDDAHRSKPLPCSICGQAFPGAESLQRHLKVHEIKQERQEVTESQETEN